MIQTPAGAPPTVTLDEARRLFAPAIDDFVAFLGKQGLKAGLFKVESAGEHGLQASIDVGLHVELLEARGCEVTSHSVLLMRHPEHGVKTVTSLLVRAPAPAGN